MAWRVAGRIDGNENRLQARRFFRRGRRQPVQSRPQEVKRHGADIGAIGEAEIDQHGTTGKIGLADPLAISIEQRKTAANINSLLLWCGGAEGQFAQQQTQNKRQAEAANDEAGFDFLAHFISLACMR